MSADLILSLLLICVGFQQPQAQPQQEAAQQPPPYVEQGQRQFNFYPGGKLEITLGVPGSLKIIGWKRGSVLVETERIIRGLTEDQAKVLATQFPLQLRWTQTTGTIRVAGPPPTAADTESNLTLYVPKDRTDMKIQMLKGNLVIGAVNGWIEATLQEGSIETASLSGYFSATTKLGDLKVNMAGKRWDGYGFTAVTQKGTVDLQLPEEYSVALQLETRSGELTVDYPEQLVDGESVPLQAVVKKNARTLSATVGAGGAPLKVMTMSGDVHLVRSQAPDEKARDVPRGTPEGQSPERP